MESISKTIKEKLQTTVNSITVNSKEKDTSTVNGKINALLEELRLEPEVIAQELAEKLGDQKSIAYYTLLAKNVNNSKLFEALSITLDADRRGKIKTKKSIYFIGILHQWDIKTKFKLDI